MYFTSIIMAFFAASALADASEVWTDASSFSAMLARGDAIAKRQQGYTPQQRTCGRGSNCQEACGPEYEQCPSTDSRIHCHVPSTGSHCCSDGTGNACKAGYYCTTDGRGHTYCCPDGIQNAECAALYSLTVSLVREASTAPPSVSTGDMPAPTSKIHVTVPSNATASFVYPTGKPNGTPSSMPPQFTGAAVKAAGAGMAMLAGAAGLLL